jgi:predicted RND superfamily exporter protein
VLWILALLIGIPATLRTIHLYANLQTEVEELLPPDAESLTAVKELRRRMPGLQFLGVIADLGSGASPERMAAAERFISDLSVRIKTYPPELVGGVRIGFAAERAFIKRHAPLLIKTADLQTIRERIEERVRHEYAQRTGALLDESEPAPPLDFSDIERNYQGTTTLSHLERDRFSSSQLGLTLLLIETGGFSTSARQAKTLIERVKSDIHTLGGPSAYVPGMRIGFTGDVAISAEETEALMQDLTLSSLLVVFAVIFALLVFFRWPASVLALFLPLALATVYAFALASLLGVQVLNSNTAFLGSIIIGNGINFGIIQLARYMEERRKGEGVHESLVRSLWGTRMGTLSAALAAGVAYASLIAMQFRGFRQFGIIGGLGMVLAWLTTILLGPPLIAWLDRNETFVEKGVLQRLARYQPATRLARWVPAYPRAILIGAIVLTIFSVFKVQTFSSSQLEYNFSNMRRRDTWQNGEGFWGRKMDTLLGQYLTPVVLLADTSEEARSLARSLREAIKSPPLSYMVASIRLLDDLLPADQAQRQAEIKRIQRKLTPNVRASLTDSQRDKIDTFLGKDSPPTLDLQTIPETLLKGLKERDGRADRAVLVYPKTTAQLWDGPRNAAFVSSLREIARTPLATGGTAARVAGGPPLTADIITSMRRDGPLASMLAFLGVILTVFLLFRKGLATPFVLGALLVGVVWMMALGMLLRIKINFVNFIAFPITFGIGVDYAVNVMARYLADKGKDIQNVIRGTGGAVGLCSLTTILGYSSLLVAQNRGLFSFGLLAVLGEMTCLTVAVVVLPAALFLRRNRSTTH